jgi:putative flippase GtrA
VGIEILAPGAGTGRRTSLAAADAGGSRTGQILRFGGVGLTTTVAYFAIFWLLRSIATPAVANLVALVITTLANTAANRRLTFGVTGRQRLLRAHAGGLLAFGLSLTMTTGTISALQLAAPRAGTLVELGALGLASALATVARFLLLRAAIYHPRRSRQLPESSRRKAA